MSRVLTPPVLVESATLTPDDLDERRRRFPAGAALTLEELEGWETGIAAQRRLREEEPVTWFGQVGGWLVTARDLVETVLSDHETFTVQAKDSFVRTVLGDHMLSRDGDDHRQQRAPYDPALRLRPVRQNYSDLISGLADTFLEHLGAGSHAELRSTYANPLSITVAGRALGLAFDDIDEVGKAYDTFAESMIDYDGVIPDTADTRARLDALITRNLDRIRDEPDSSILSSVLTAEDPALRHTDEEIVGNVRIILFGAIETVTSIILSTTWALLNHPEQLSDVRAGAVPYTAAINETLRWISPVGHSERWVASDTELGGVRLPRGDMVLPSMAAANRDPAFFSSPDAFDVHRANARHHGAFGRGSHHCIGLNLGNLEGQIAVQKLLTAFPTLALDPRHPVQPTGFGFRSPHELRVMWDG
jgi:cytochrome P450